MAISICNLNYEVFYFNLYIYIYIYHFLRISCINEKYFFYIYPATLLASSKSICTSPKFLSFFFLTTYWVPFVLPIFSWMLSHSMGCDWPIRVHTLQRDSSLSQKHYLSVAIRQGVGACELLPLPRWNVGQIDLLQVFLHVACLKIISMGSMLECLPTMHKALGSFPKASKIKKYYYGS